MKPYFPIFIVAVVLALFPVVTDSNVLLTLLIYSLIIGLAAQGWNVLAGIAGQNSFGHAAFFGTGAYVISLWQTNLHMNPWVGFLIALLVGAALGSIIGYLAFRAGLRGSYFALVTLAIAEVLRVLANAASFTGGAAGSLLPINPGWEHFQFSDRRYFYWITLALVVLSLVLVKRIQRSRFGAQLVAVRENEGAAQALGINVLATKLKAIAISGAMTAAAGCLYAQCFLYIDASLVYGSKMSVEMLLAAIVGGIGTVFGPLVGALALHVLSEVVKVFAGDIPGIDLAIYGAVLIMVVCFLPKGLLSLGTRFRKKKYLR